jgi:hypothetical protein
VAHGAMKKRDDKNHKNEEQQHLFDAKRPFGVLTDQIMARNANRYRYYDPV